MERPTSLAAVALALSMLTADVHAEPANAEAMKLLSNKDWAERIKGLERLAADGKSPAAEKAVLPLLEDDDWGVEIAACKTLAKVGADGSKDALVRCALAGEIQWVRDAAVDALKAMDPIDAAHRMLEKARNAGPKDEATRVRAYVSAGRMGGAEVVKRLTERAASREENLAAAALRGLALVAHDPAFSKDVVAAASSRLSDRAEKKTFFVYAGAIEALGQAPGAEAAGLLAKEVVLLPDDDLYAQERIGRGLETRPADEVAVAVRAAFAAAKKSEETRRVARLAGRVKCAGVRSELEGLLDHKDERVRSEATKALGLVRDAASVRALSKALDDKSVFVRIEAVDALARTMSPADFRGLGERLTKDASDVVRIQFVVALNDAADPAGIPAVAAFLPDPTWRVASAAAAALGTLGVAEDLPKLEPLLTHKLWQIRAAAYEGLGRLRAPKAVPLLTLGLADKDPVVKGVCLANLQILTREKLGPEPQPWRDWWAKNAATANFAKQSRRSAEQKAADAAKNKDYGNQTREGGVQILQKARILVVTGAWDHVEKVLGHLDIPFTLLRAQQIKQAGVNPNQIVLVNCEGNMDKDSLERVQWFVNVGGYLMTTDWALTKTVEPGFSGYLKQYAASSTGNDVVVVENARPGHPFTAGVFDNVPALKWWLEIQAFPMTVAWPERVEVLVDSAEMRQRYGSSPMAAAFRWGLGKVQHSASHFYLQEEGMQAAREPRARMVFAADNLGLSLEEIRKLAKDGRFEGGLNEETMKQIAPSYSMFRLIVNVVKEKSDWVENL